VLHRSAPILRVHEAQWIMPFKAYAAADRRDRSPFSPTTAFRSRIACARTHSSTVTIASWACSRDRITGSLERRRRVRCPQEGSSGSASISTLRNFPHAS